jgi:predicted nucleic acid-binding protein
VGTLLDTTVFIEFERALRDLPVAHALSQVGARLEEQLGPAEEVGIAVAARAHARIWAGLAASGLDVGAHDRLVAASAIAAGWRVGTANLRHFGHIPGLELVVLRFGG